MRCKTLSRKDGLFLRIEDFPNFFATGSIEGMKKLYYGEDALLVRCGDYIYWVGKPDPKDPTHYDRGRFIYYVRAH